MSVQRIQKLTTKFTATIAAVAVALAQPMLSPCQCSAASGDSCCASSVELSCCCGDRCGVFARSCCCTPEAPTRSTIGCGCSASSSKLPASAPNSAPRVVAPRVVESDSSPLSIAVVPAFADCGLNGAAWATAFDLEALDSPPGVRLHALLCVWRI